MRIIEQHEVGGPEVLTTAEVATPDPGAGEVRIRNSAIGVNPIDVAVRAGAFPLLGDPPFVLGWDVAGTVEQLGEGVTELSVGDRVFGMPRFPQQAAGYAEYVVVPADELIATPRSLDDEHAAAIPMAGLTAWQALVEVGNVTFGQRVLVHAAGGGVGHFAVQIAKARGAHVVATASAGKVDFVTGLGADEVIDYRAGDFSAGLRPVDLAIDPLGGDLTARTLDVVADGGVLATLLPVTDDGITEQARRRDVRHAPIFVSPRRESLRGLVELVTAGKLVSHVSAIYPLDKAGDAHGEFASGALGKVVLVP